MANVVVVHKGRTVKLSVNLGFDSSDTFTSEIRALPDRASTLIATWTVTNVQTAPASFDLVLDDALTAAITAKSGYMDLKRISGGQPIDVFDRPLEVEFRGTVTA